ncbi:GNAT family N-acetyltransferase [Niallia oryzisoli]|uniref:GNAT family N-acetyltransferase n=1 Tax=Niallia oryzisoli TaxID=1737571 RepID=A0ABZ2CJJ4_9BACI
MSIRKATNSETEEILTYSLKVLTEATMGFVEPNIEKVIPFGSSFLKDGGYYLVCNENNTIKGWIGIGAFIDYYSDELVGMIPEIYVIPQYRNQGIGEQLCCEAMKHLKEQGFSKVQLNVYTGNRAKHLYQKLGFQEVSTIMERNLDQVR